MSDSKIKTAALRQQQSERVNFGESVKLEKVLTFYIENQIYGIEIPYITEIIGIQPFVNVPWLPSFIKGVINVRSKVVPIVSIRSKFGKPEIAYTERTSIIIVSFDDITVGLIVDKVAGVHDVYENTVSPTPTHSEVNTSRFIKYIIRENDDIRLILDMDKLLNDDKN